MAATRPSTPGAEDALSALDLLRTPETAGPSQPTNSAPPRQPVENPVPSNPAAVGNANPAHVDTESLEVYIKICVFGVSMFFFGYVAGTVLKMVILFVASLNFARPSHVLVNLCKRPCAFLVFTGMCKSVLWNCSRN